MRFELVRDGERVAGVLAQTPQGSLRVEASLVVACDGRHSTMRACAGFEVLDVGAPIDVLWMRISRHEHDPGQTFGTVVPGCVFVMIDRGEYYQCAMVIRKGGFAAVQSQGIDAFRGRVRDLAPFLDDRVHELSTWDDVKLLTVTVDRLQRWYAPGLLCIGDAAHAMSPIGGVGINLAIQDAVAAANALYQPLLEDRVDTEDLHRVQRRREFPTRVIQRVQVVVQNLFVNRVLSTKGAIAPPPLMRALGTVPLLRRIPAYLVGVGVRRERVHTPSRFNT